MPITSDDVELRELHGRVSVEMGWIVARLAPGDLERATPCTGWDVRALLEHHAAQTDALAWAIEGGGPDLERWRPRPVDEPAQAVLQTSDTLRTLLVDDRVWDRRVWMPEISEEVAFTTARTVTFHFIDTMVHAWDVAAGIGVVVHFDSDVLRLARVVADQVPGGQARTAPGAAFAPTVATTSNRATLDAILAVLGRDAAWQPPAIRLNGPPTSSPGSATERSRQVQCGSRSRSTTTGA